MNVFLCYTVTYIVCLCFADEQSTDVDQIDVTVISNVTDDGSGAERKNTFFLKSCRSLSPDINSITIINLY